MMSKVRPCWAKPSRAGSERLLIFSRRSLRGAKFLSNLSSSVDNASLSRCSTLPVNGSTQVSRHRRRKLRKNIAERPSQESISRTATSLSLKLASCSAHVSKLRDVQSLENTLPTYQSPQAVITFLNKAATQNHIAAGAGGQAVGFRAEAPGDDRHRQQIPSRPIRSASELAR